MNARVVGMAPELGMGFEEHPKVTDVRAGYYILAAQPIRVALHLPNQAYRRAAMLAREYGRPVRMMIRALDHGPLKVCGGVAL